MHWLKTSNTWAGVLPAVVRETSSSPDDMLHQPTKANCYLAQPQWCADLAAQHRPLHQHLDHQSVQLAPVTRTACYPLRQQLGQMSDWPRMGNKNASKSNISQLLQVSLTIKELDTLLKCNARAKQHSWGNGKKQIWTTQSRLTTTIY